jgi:hypothetical protein
MTNPIAEFFEAARREGAVIGPFASRRDAQMFRSRANTYRRNARREGDHGLDHLVMRITQDHRIVAAPLAAPPIRALEPGDFA